jgi:GrpB-like predicted nucleotidyltransferase (UPF0157 family)
MWRGRVVWPSAHAWRACFPQGNEGSNPSLSARRIGGGCYYFSPLEEWLQPPLFINSNVDESMVEILPYQISWLSDFRLIASCLREGLGNLASRIDHIGSTSVPGLAAKDVIDIQITVANLGQELSMAMVALGYNQRAAPQRDHPPAGFEGDETEWEKWYFDAPPGQRRTHTHVRVAGRANQRYPLLFRDYLRTHPAIAEAYAELKRRLAVNLADPQTYPVVKDPAVDLIYLAAEDWAEITGWQPGPSDA